MRNVGEQFAPIGFRLSTIGLCAFAINAMLTACPAKTIGKSQLTPRSPPSEKKWPNRLSRNRLKQRSGG